MPLVRGDRKDEDGDGPPRGRIRNTGKLLLGAAALMSVLLLASSMVTTLLIPGAAYRDGGQASGRALAYLAHLYLGHAFGTVYDLSTILILWFAGASAMAGLLQLIPRYLPRLGMAPQWAAMARPLVLVLFVIDLCVTLVFRGSVEHQAGAYATGVLVPDSVGLRRQRVEPLAGGAHRPTNGIESQGPLLWYLRVVFAYTLVINVKERPDGIIIASIFISLLIATSIASRYQSIDRTASTEVHIRGRGLGATVETALRRRGEHGRRSPRTMPDISTIFAKSQDLVQRHRSSHLCRMSKCSTTVASSMSGFASLIAREKEDYVVTVSGANVIANTLVYISLELKARAVLMHLAEQRYPLNQAMKYILFGTGEVGLMVYEILTAYWKDRPAPERPLLFLMAG